MCSFTMHVRGLFWKSGFDAYFGQLASTWKVLRNCQPARYVACLHAIKLKTRCYAFQQLVNTQIVWLLSWMQWTVSHSLLLYGTVQLNLVTMGELAKNHLFELIVHSHDSYWYIRLKKFLTICYWLSTIMDDYKLDLTKHNKVVNAVRVV